MIRGDGAVDADPDAPDADPDAADPDTADDEFEAAVPVDPDSDRPASDGDPDRPMTDDDGRLRIPIETLAVLNWLGDVGVEGVESRLDRVTAADVTVETEQVKVDYAGAETVLSRFGAADRAGARVRIQSPFAGDVLVLFPVKSANRAASLMLERAVADAASAVSTPMGRDALTELCNVVANGFVDEWATVFDTPFDTGAPTAVQNPELTLLHRIFSDSDVGLYITARFRLVEPDVDAAVFVFPGEERFVTKLSQVDPATLDR